MAERLSEEVVWMYYHTLAQLADEGNEAAKEVWNQLHTDRQSLNLRDWVTNVHLNDWPVTNFAAIVKARVVRNRMKK